MKTSPVYDAARLSKTFLYQIDGCFYRFKGINTNAKAPRYEFEPLNGQRRHTGLILNSSKLASVYVIEDMIVSGHDTVTENHTQLSLF
ncbi:MAG: hypothetical protein KME46_32630 [Brasilonema angustatum HA4187-MV1]|jgi:hypothetical protein|nr:hypothetical protein [Brasilonema angustatum HA4187-MV1]